jgi:ArsR family transcriptional regulator
MQLSSHPMAVAYYIDTYLYVFILQIDIHLYDVIKMDKKYKGYARIFKALSDPNRLMIADMLSCGELCACRILERFHITQPTLSHHMKNLCDSGLVKERKEGKWTYYSLSDDAAKSLRAFLEEITTIKEKCVCNETCEEGCC